ncbi:hypothetical protein ACLMJK_006876 [Lecanora helva]
MAPKKAQSKDSKSAKGAEEQQETPAQTSESKNPVEEKPSTDAASKKRKAQQLADSNKAPRRSARGAAPIDTDPVKILQYLLSPSSLDVCRPKDESEDVKNRPNIRTYSSSSFTPFEELVCALILSRPIGHMLGVRSIRTIFNAPYELTTPKKIRELGKEGCREALDNARTQHRQKTAEELVILADAVVDHLGDGEEDVTLEKVRKECGYDAEKEREMLKKHVKGMGKTGLDIFSRRIQGAWPKFYPFIDERTMTAVEMLGLPKSAEGLRDFLNEHWKSLDAKDIEAKDEEEKKRKAFVRILERAVGAQLEGNIDSIKAEAA